MTNTEWKVWKLVATPQAAAVMTISLICLADLVVVAAVVAVTANDEAKTLCSLSRSHWKTYTAESPRKFD
jgi:hypothetical protein